MGNEKPRRGGRLLSFKYAFEGIYAGIKEEPNLKFHFSFAILVIALGIYFGLTKLEWIAISIMIGLVLTSEMTNTAVEAIVDSFTEEQHPRAKYAKDIAAGAVLIVAITSVVVGLLIFLPHIIL